MSVSTRHDEVPILYRKFLSLIGYDLSYLYAWDIRFEKKSLRWLLFTTLHALVTASVGWRAVGLSL